MEPLVTVGIINYNCKQYLENCVTSYLNQPYENMELLVVDDGSTDGSVELLKSLEKTHEKVRCIYHAKNSGGPSHGIQEIVAQARGKYFQWIASDDFVALDALGKFVSYLEETKKDYVYCNFNIVDENNRITSTWNYALPTLKEMVYRIFTNCSGIMPMNGLYRTGFFRENNLTWQIYKENDYSCDTINSLYFVKNGMEYGMIKENLIHYRIHSNNHSHNIGQRIRTSLSVYDFIIHNFSEELYLPHIDWNGCGYRAQLKNYTLSLFLYNKIVDYLQGKGIPRHTRYTMTEEMLKQYLQSYAAEGLYYLRNGLSQGNDLRNELEALEEKYLKLFPEECGKE